MLTSIMDPVLFNSKDVWVLGDIIFCLLTPFMIFWIIGVVCVQFILREIYGD